jgi:hypothetical protein
MYSSFLTQYSESFFDVRPDWALHAANHGRIPLTYFVLFKQICGTVAASSASHVPSEAHRSRRLRLTLTNRRHPKTPDFDSIYPSFSPSSLIAILPIVLTSNTAVHARYVARTWEYWTASDWVSRKLMAFMSNLYLILLRG